MTIKPKSIDNLLPRIFTSCVILPKLLALMAIFSAVAFAQDPQDPQEPPVVYENLTQYLTGNEEYIPGGDVAHWDHTDYWSEHVIPPDTCNSIFVVGDGFHLRAHNGTGYTQQIFGTSDSTKPNFLYIGYGVDLTTGTVDLNTYAFAALHLKGQNWVKDTITIDQLYLGNGEVFQGAAGSTMTLDGNVTIEGNAAFRNVAEANNGDDVKEDRVLIIKSHIHGTGTLNFEAEKTHGLHTTEIYITSENNDFSGNVCIDSGTHVHIDDEHQEHYYYDYQTHLFLTGENALYKASIVLNEGIVKITANQTFKNYFSGIDEHQEGVFNGIGTLIIDNGNNPVAVTLTYDDAESLNKPLGQITASAKSVLTFDLPDEDEIKKITMSEADNNYSKIESQGQLVKTGDGTLQIAAAAEGLIGAESFVISSGRVDMEGYFTGAVQLGEELPSGDFTQGVFSPGDVVGATANIIGDFDVNDGSTLEFAQNAAGMDKLIASDFTVDSNSIIDLIMGAYLPGTSYPIIVQTSGAFTGDYASNDFWNSLLSDASAENWELSVREGNKVYAKIKGDPPTPVAGVPEPSTWALLVLGVAGLLYVRKRVRNF